MTDQMTTLAELKQHIQAFAHARGWCDSENAKDYVMALSVETAELMEIFTWLHSDQADTVKDNPAVFEHLREEIADVFWYLCRLCNHFDIDLSAAVAEKSIKNARKYPLEK